MSETPAPSPATPEQKPANGTASGSTPAVPDKPAAGAAATAVAEPPKPQEPVKFTSKPMKIGVVPFLNAQPLAWDLRNHHQVFTVNPNEMAGLLKEGRLDVGLAPITAKFLNPELQIVPVAAIGSKGPVKSVRILSHGPLQEVRRLFVDSRSQTSVLLARLVLKKWYGVRDLEVKAVDMEGFHPNQVKPWEATLQFGDKALIAAPTGMTVTDLGEEWDRRTGKPFVYAVWMARDVPTAREIEMDLKACKTEGLKHFEDVARAHKGIWVFDHPKAKEYLEKNIHYAYTAVEVQGQIEFQKLLKEEGLIL